MGLARAQGLSLPGGFGPAQGPATAGFGPAQGGEGVIVLLTGLFFWQAFFCHPTGGGYFADYF